MESQNQNIIYRSAVMEDAPSLCGIEAIRLVEAKQPVVLNNEIKAYWEDILGSNLNSTYVAELPGNSNASLKLLGYAVLSQDISESSIFIIPGSRRKGLAHSLLQTAGVCCYPETTEISALLEADQRALEVVAI